MHLINACFKINKEFCEVEDLWRSPFDIRHSWVNLIGVERVLEIAPNPFLGIKLGIKLDHHGCQKSNTRFFFGDFFSNTQSQ
jgi:hypothetical protein